MEYVQLVLNVLILSFVLRTGYDNRRLTKQVDEWGEKAATWEVAFRTSAKLLEKSNIDLDSVEIKEIVKNLNKEAAKEYFKESADKNPVFH